MTTNARFDFLPRISGSSSSASRNTLSFNRGCDTSLKPNALRSNRSLPRTVPKLPLPRESRPGCRSSRARRPISIDLPVCSSSSNSIDSRGGASWKLSSSSARSSIAIEKLGRCSSGPFSMLFRPVRLGSSCSSREGRGFGWLVRARTKILRYQLDLTCSRLGTDSC